MRKKLKTLGAVLLALMIISSASVSAYAGSSAPKYDKNGANIGRDPSNGRDFVWFINVGSGVWEFDGITYTVLRNGAPASGVMDLHYNDNIRIDSPAGRAGIRVYLAASGGTKVELMFSGDGNVCVGRRTPEGSYVPFNVDLVVEYDEEEGRRNKLYSVDFGGGSWTVRGTEVTATVNGKKAEGTMRISGNDTIILQGRGDVPITVRVYGDNGFSAELEISGDDGVSLGRVMGGTALPSGLTFKVEGPNDDPEDGEDPEGRPAEGPDSPDGKDSDNPDGPPEDEPYSAVFEPEKMTAQERDAYEKLSDEERRNISEIVRNIVISARPGSIDEALDKKIWDIAKNNGLSPGEDVSFYTIQFDGSAELDFPVRVTVSVQHNDLPGGRTLYVYHVDQNGGIQYLGEAEYTTYKDGNVETLSFCTRSFSDFLISSEKLAKGADDRPVEGGGGSGFPVVPVAIGAVVVIAAAAVIIAKKKNKPAE